MALLAINPILESEQLDQTHDFYTGTLGFTAEVRVEGWLSLVRDHVRIMFCEPNAHREFTEASLTGSLYLYTDEVDAIWDRLKDKVKLCYNLESFDYGMREFGFYDNNGYLLKFGQPVNG
ncbi:MAG: VOC family protein [Gammaproteobacteria bacterium]|nr:VOC family protein [Gammaproteobacteria bacterium]